MDRARPVNLDVGQRSGRLAGRIAKRARMVSILVGTIVMTHSVQDLLDTFDRLPEAEQREAVSEILRRVCHLDLDPLSDDELIQSAEDVFLELDRREVADDCA
jgi:hypothetical protein